MRDDGYNLGKSLPSTAFSMGGYTAARIQRDYPNLKYIKVGAPGTSGDIELPVDHMDMPASLAKGKFVQER